jgi:hypothetical protein
MTHPGVKPLGPELVEHLQGSEPAKTRLKTMLRAMQGELTVPEACAQLGIGETRFYVQRAETLQAALASLEPRPAGRPRQVVSPEQERIAELEQRVRELQLDVQAAEIRREAQAIRHGRQPACAAVPLKKPGRES